MTKTVTKMVGAALVVLMLTGCQPGMTRANGPLSPTAAQAARENGEAAEALAWVRMRGAVQIGNIATEMNRCRIWAAGEGNLEYLDLLRQLDTMGSIVDGLASAETEYGQLVRSLAPVMLRDPGREQLVREETQMMQRQIAQMETDFQGTVEWGNKLAGMASCKEMASHLTEDAGQTAKMISMWSKFSEAGREKTQHMEKLNRELRKTARAAGVNILPPLPMPAN